MEKPKLDKTCPFCNGVGSLIESANGTGIARCVLGCGATVLGETVEHAKEKWDAPRKGDK